MREALQTSLKKLGVDYVDLYLMHWPQAFAEDGKHPANIVVSHKRDFDTIKDASCDHMKVQPSLKLGRKWNY